MSYNTNRGKLHVEALECRRLLALVPVMVTDFDPGSYSYRNPGIGASVGDTAYFGAQTRTAGYEFWRTDGTPEGTILVKDFNPGEPHGLFTIHDLGDQLLLTASSVSEPTGLYTSDGTTQGTVRIPNVSFTENLQERTVVNGKLFFATNDGVHGEELWVSDGTETGTKLVKDIKDGPTSSHLQKLTKVGDTLYFWADDGVHGFELWKSDGTEEGTVMVRDIRTDGDTYIQGLEAVGDMLYFVGDDGLTGRELWKSDGTEAGTVRVTDGAPGAAHWTASQLTDVDGTLFFRANDAEGHATLYKSDGTPEGTVKVKRIYNPSSASLGSLYQLTNMDGTLYFQGHDGASGFELWVSDGTEAGTRLVKDINPFPVSRSTDGSSPHEFTNVDGLVYFIANDGVSGEEIWVTNGSAAGTYRVADIRAGAEGSSPEGLTNVNGTLYFTANDGIHGYELWKLVPEPVLGDTDADSDVDLDDLNNVRNHFGEIGERVSGDTDSDDDVDLDDLNNVRNNFGLDGSSPTRQVSVKTAARATEQDALFRGDTSAPTASLRKRVLVVDHVFAVEWHDISSRTRRSGQAARRQT